MRRFRAHYDSYKRKGSKEPVIAIRVHNLRLKNEEIRDFIFWLEDHGMGIRADVVRIAHANALEFKSGDVSTEDVIELVKQARATPVGD